jgi:acyl-CoA thioester hydrolase
MTTPPDDVVEAMNKYKSPEQWYCLKKILKASFPPHNIDPAEFNI